MLEKFNITMQIRIFFAIFCLNLVYAAQPIGSTNIDDDPNAVLILYVATPDSYYWACGR
jgi:hypothetical protein